MNNHFEKLDAALAANQPVTLPAVRNWPETPHLLDPESVWALKMALATGRPLLLRGDPGTGKSQLARAAAQVLGWPFLSRVVNARFEPEDLLFRFDAVARLAKAQILKPGPASEAQLNARHFLLPEVMWWALNHKSAETQYVKAQQHCGETGCSYGTETGFPFGPKIGVVVLIDEIDKADSEVPNSLLEALSTGGFQLPYGGETVTPDGIQRLIVITTNEERELPAAFLRRCLVHHMDLPSDEVAFRKYLTARALAHLSAQKRSVNEETISKAIDQLILDRKEAENGDLPKPGQAELLDLLKAIAVLGEVDSKTVQNELLETLAGYSFRKNRLEV